MRALAAVWGLAAKLRCVGGVYGLGSRLSHRPSTARIASGMAEECLPVLGLGAPLTDKKLPSAWIEDQRSEVAGQDFNKSSSGHGAGAGVAGVRVSG